ncbi:hypothetical protein RB653_003935 [Dictyostelium firmibasis]|uniref:Carbohydrate binding domain-containing protein n=1 Tax=Dictyostelium firmibasis TaxID=79012 RepID=A0AAN7YZK5_9MYCE
MIKSLKLLINLLIICSFITEIYCNEYKVPFSCIRNSCLQGHRCIEDSESGLSKCIDESTRKIVFQSTITNKWHNNNDMDAKMQVSVDIINQNIHPVQNLIIAIEDTVKLNDIWGMSKNKSVYQLPWYAQIQPNSTYTFGYICDGFLLPKIYLGAVYILI